MPINDFGIISVDIAIYINIANLKLRKGLEVMSKKFFAVLLFCIVAAFVQAQSMKITPKDFVDASDESKNYVVLNFAGRSQNDLYKTVLKYVNSYYNNPEKVTTKIEGEQIVIDAMEQKAVYTTYLAAKTYYDFYYKITLDFKDGKVRFAPNYKYFVSPGGIEYPLNGRNNFMSKNALYGSSGKVARKSLQEGLDVFINKYITEFSKSINDSKSNDNW